MDCVSPSNFLVILIPRELFKAVSLYKHGLDTKAMVLYCSTLSTLPAFIVLPLC